MAEVQTETQRKPGRSLMQRKALNVNRELVTDQDIGQTVLYRLGAEQYPAMIIAINKNLLTLAVFTPQGMQIQNGVEYSARGKAGFWSWPAYSNRKPGGGAAAQEH
jgi:hypothetical protein